MDAQNAADMAVDTSTANNGQGFMIPPQAIMPGYGPYQGQPFMAMSPGFQPSAGYGFAYGAQFQPGVPPGQVAMPGQPAALPPGMPPLMPISTLSWAPVPGQPLLVAHSVGCAICTEFLRHYGAASSDSAFREAQTSVQAEMQARFWRHFEEHARSEGGRAREESEKVARELEEARARIGELETQLSRARRIGAEEKEAKERYRSERNEERERVEDLEEERKQLARQLDSLRAPSASSWTHGSSSSGFVPRDPREMSPRRDRQDTARDRVRTPPRYGPTGRSGDGPHEGIQKDFLTEFTAFSDESDEEEVYDTSRIKKIADRQKVRNARRDVPPPPAPVMGHSMNMQGRYAPTIRIPEGWPMDMLALPAESDARLTSHWYNFVPVNTEDARRLMSAAHTDTGEARHRIQHLLAQISNNPALTGVQGMRVLNEHWRNAERSQGPVMDTSGRSFGRRGSPQYTPPGLIPTSTAHLPPPTTRFRNYTSDPAKPRINQPRLTDPVSRWVEWLSLHLSRIPAWMERADGSMEGPPLAENVELHLLVRRPVHRTVSVDDRGRWINMSQELFSVPGLYRHIVQRGGYPRQPVYSPHARFTGPYLERDLSLFHVARWYASAGVSYEMADRLQRSAWRARALFFGRDYADQGFQFPGANSIQDVPVVPSLFDLQQYNVPVVPPTIAASTVPTAAPPIVAAATLPAEPIDSEMTDGHAVSADGGLAPTPAPDATGPTPQPADAGAMGEGPSAT